MVVVVGIAIDGGLRFWRGMNGWCEVWRGLDFLRRGCFVGWRDVNSIGLAARLVRLDPSRYGLDLGCGRGDIRGGRGVRADGVGGFGAGARFGAGEGEDDLGLVGDGVDFAVDGGDAAEELIGEVADNGGAAGGDFVFDQEADEGGDEVVEMAGGGEVVELGAEVLGDVDVFGLVGREQVMLGAEGRGRDWRDGGSGCRRGFWRGSVRGHRRRGAAGFVRWSEFWMVRRSWVCSFCSMGGYTPWVYSELGVTTLMRMGLREHV